MKNEIFNYSEMREREIEAVQTILNVIYCDDNLSYELAMKYLENYIVGKYEEVLHFDR